jgi:hypothetical protein
MCLENKNPQESWNEIIQYIIPLVFYVAAKLGILKQGTLEENQQQRGRT